MFVPSSAFEKSVQEGGIYYFKSDKISSEESHYYVVVKRYADSMLLMLCSTTQFEKRKQFLEKRNIPYTTLVWAKPTTQNELKKDSYFDCNTCLHFDISELADKYQLGELKVKGNLEVAILEQIRIGITDSPLVEEEIKTLINSSEAI